MAVLLREWLGFNVKVIPGYTDSGVLYLAIERGEVDGIVTAPAHRARIQARASRGTDCRCGRHRRA